MRDITLPPSPERRLRSLRRSAIVLGVAVATSILAIVISMVVGQTALAIGFGMVMIFQTAQFIWMVQELRRGSREQKDRL